MADEPLIVLASASPRRSELLELAGISFRIAPADIPEQPLPGEEAVPHALRLAEEKARTAAEREAAGRWFIGADTIVVLEGRIMGKPVDEQEARQLNLPGYNLQPGFTLSGLGALAEAALTCDRMVQF